MSSKCQELAATLNANYFSNSTFDKSGPKSLMDFLQTTGILLSMCIGNSCTDTSFFPVPLDHFSGSWIQDSTTGPRIFGKGGVGYGMVLAPAKTEIHCIYPLDGFTIDRTNLGCGPMQYEDGGGFQPTWSARQALKLRISWRKWTHFRNTAWQDIPCSQLFHGFDYHPYSHNDHRTNLDLNQVVGMVDHHQRWETNSQWIQSVSETLLGHTVCWDDSVPAFDDDDPVMLPYIGNDSWKPLEWNQAATITQNITQHHPKAMFWNEIVMKNIDNNDDDAYADVVQAMFYVRGPKQQTWEEDRQKAYTEAKRFGGKHVLVFDPEVDYEQQQQETNRTLFQCDEDDNPPHGTTSSELLHMQKQHYEARQQIR